MDRSSWRLSFSTKVRKREVGEGGGKLVISNQVK